MINIIVTLIPCQHYREQHGEIALCFYTHPLSVISQVTPNQRFPTFLATAHQLMLGHVTAPPPLHAHWCMPICTVYSYVYMCTHSINYAANMWYFTANFQICGFDARYSLVPRWSSSAS